jgi:hypothetical protein
MGVAGISPPDPVRCCREDDGRAGVASAAGEVGPDSPRPPLRRGLAGVGKWWPGAWCPLTIGLGPGSQGGVLGHSMDRPPSPMMRSALSDRVGGEGGGMCGLGTEVAPMGLWYLI